MPDYCADSRSAARHILTFKASRVRGAIAVAGLRCIALQARELISKSSEIRAEFRKS